MHGHISFLPEESDQWRLPLAIARNKPRSREQSGVQLSERLRDPLNAMSKVTMLRRSAGAVQEVLQGQRERALAAFLPQGFSTASLSSVASSQNVATESSASAGTAAAASVGTSEEGVVGSLKQRFLWRVVKSSLLIAATGAVGGAAYVTYCKVLLSRDR